MSLEDRYPARRRTGEPTQKGGAQTSGFAIAFREADLLSFSVAKRYCVGIFNGNTFVRGGSARTISDGYPSLPLVWRGFRPALGAASAPRALSKIVEKVLLREGWNRALSESRNSYKASTRTRHENPVLGSSRPLGRFAGSLSAICRCASVGDRPDATRPSADRSGTRVG